MGELVMTSAAETSCSHFIRCLSHMFIYCHRRYRLSISSYVTSFRFLAYYWPYFRIIADFWDKPLRCYTRNA